MCPIFDTKSGDLATMHKRDIKSIYSFLYGRHFEHIFCKPVSLSSGFPTRNIFFKMADKQEGFGLGEIIFVLHHTKKDLIKEYDQW